MEFLCRSKKRLAIICRRFSEVLQIIRGNLKCTVGARRRYVRRTLDTNTDEVRKLIKAARLPVQLTSPPHQQPSPTLYLFMCFEVRLWSSVL
jgi:hypothetical protein